jgi:peroxiredoxin
VSVFGVSRDSPWSHVAWSQALDIDVPLLSDWNGDAVRAFGIAFDYRGLHEVAARSAFLVDAGGVLRGAWRYGTDDVPHFDELVAAARELGR